MTFNPYLKWLGIREKSPSYYRLLGVEEFESDVEVIRNAADRQMAHIRSYQLGPNAEICQEVLNRLAKSRAVLLKPELKKKYDQNLTRKLARKVSAKPSAVSSPVPTGDASFKSAPVKKGPEPKVVFEEEPAGKSMVPILGLVGGLVLTVIAGVVLALQFWKSDPDQGVQLADRKQPAARVNPQSNPEPPAASKKSKANPKTGVVAPPKTPSKNERPATSKNGANQVAEDPTKESDKGSNRPAGKTKTESKAESKRAKPSVKSESQKSKGAVGANQVVRFEDPKELKFSNSAYGIAISADRKFLAAVGKKNIAIWRISDWKKVASNKTDGPAKMFGVQFSNDGKYLFVGGTSSTILVLDTKELKLVNKYKVHSRTLHRITTIPDSDYFNVLSNGGNLYTIHPLKGVRERRRVFENDSRGVVTSRGKTFAVGNQPVKGKKHFSLARYEETGMLATTVMNIPESCYRINIGKDDNEILIPMVTQVALLDCFENKLLQTWELPNRELMTDFIYWPERDLYLTSNGKGSLDVLMRNHKKPVASHKISSSRCYQMLPLDDSTVITASMREHNAVVVWKVAFDEGKLEKLSLAEPDFGPLSDEGFVAGGENDSYLIFNTEPITKSKVPSVEESASAKQFVNERYKDYFKSKSSRAQRQLGKYLKEYKATSIPMQWVLWSDSVDAYAKGGDIVAALDVLETMDEYFEIDFMDRAKSLLKLGGVGARWRDDDVENPLEQLVRLSVKKRDFEMARSFFGNVMDYVKKNSRAYAGPGWQVRRKQLEEFEDSLDDLEKIYKLFEKSKSTVESKPNDKVANCRVGDYYFFLEGDLNQACKYWERSNSPLQLIAQSRVRRKRDLPSEFWTQQINSYEGFLAQKVAQRALELCLKEKESEDEQIAGRANQQEIVLTDYLNQMMILDKDNEKK